MSNPTSFSALKRSRGSVEKLTQAIQNLNTKNEKKEDDRFWEPTVDKAGNGIAILRFLPAPPQDGEDGLPWVRTFSHGFQGPGGWLIDLCLTTLDQKCPVCEQNTVLWNSGVEANKTIARVRKRKLSYFANVLVVSDPAKPEFDGKVKLYRFGKKIFDKISEKMHPEFADEKAFSPFDLWDGANFKLKIRQVEGYRNYDKSEFAAQAPVSTDDAVLEKLWQSEFSLREFVAPKHFKTHEQLAARMTLVLGSVAINTSAEKSIAAALSDATDDADVGVIAPVGHPGLSGAGAPEEDDMSFFQTLAEDR
jgi:hypothetical protein